MIGCVLISVSCSVVEESAVDSFDHYYVEAESIIPETKTMADEEGRVLWNRGDYVSVFERVSYQTKYQYAGGNGTSGGGLIKVEDPGSSTGGPVSHYYAVFPYEETNGLDNNENLVLRFHNNQVNGYRSFGSTDNLTVAVAEDNHFRFKNVGGYLVIRLYGEGDVVSLTFRGNSDERIAGDVKVTASLDFSDNTKPSSTIMYGRQYPGSETFTEITLDCVDPEFGPVSLVDDKEQAEDFWLVLPPMTFTKGFTFVVTDTQGRTFTKSTSSSYTVERSTKKWVRTRVEFSTPVESVSLDVTESELAVGETRTLVATVLPANATDKAVTWSTSDATVATVDSEGKVTALKVGSAIITAAAGEKTAECSLTVIPVAVTGVTLNKEELSLLPGETSTLVATVLPENAADKSVTWTSSNTTVATVDATGKVTAKAVGTTTVTVTTTDSGETASCTVHVNPIAVTGVSLNNNTLRLVNGTSETLTVTVLPENATNKSVTWTSSNTSVATVSNGTVTAKSVGTATITATAEGKSATCAVTVTPVLVSGITLNSSTANVNVGSTLTLTATVTPSNAADKSITWSTSNSTVATVSTSGVVTGVKAGTATITATANDGSGVTATCTVTVNNVAVSSITLNKTTLRLVNGTSETLTATVLPTNATDKTVSWSSDDTSIASVDASGNVTANAVGTTMITAEAGEMVATCTVTVTPILISSITLDKSSISGGYLIIETLSATVSPANAANKALTWSISNSEVAEISNSSNSLKKNITFKKAGTATITVSANDGSGVMATCTVTTTLEEYVDLGLSVKWATCNIGATNPDEYGSYYAWGETQTKTSYTWQTYAFGSYQALTKYNNDSSHGVVDNKSQLELVDDAARVILKNSWRMPTEAEWNELYDECDWYRYGNGMKVVGKNGNYIYLPLGGYWSSSLDTSYSYDAIFMKVGTDEGTDAEMESHSRSDGLVIRPVRQ